jgi:hypothetical protein
MNEGSPAVVTSMIGTCNTSEQDLYTPFVAREVRHHDKHPVVLRAHSGT